MFQLYPHFVLRVRACVRWQDAGWLESNERATRMGCRRARMRRFLRASMVSCRRVRWRRRILFAPIHCPFGHYITRDVTITSVRSLALILVLDLIKPGHATFDGPMCDGPAEVCRWRGWAPAVVCWIAGRMASSLSACGSIS